MRRLIAGGTIFAATLAWAQTTVYWDTNSTTAGASAGTTAAGTWDNATTAAWSTNSAGTAATTNWNALAAASGGIATFAAGTNATGTYTVTVSGTVSNVRGLTFEEGAVTLSGGTLALSGNSTINTNANNATISSVISGTSLGITKTGSGNLTLSGANLYTGATNIGTAGGASGGTITLGAANIFANTSNINVYAGTLALGANSDTVGAVALGGGASGTTASITGTGTLTLGGNLTYDATNNPNGALISAKLALGANRTFTVGDSTAAASDLTISGVISGANAITKSGAGTLELSATNTYTGATTISQGTIQVDTNAPNNSNGALGKVNGAVTINDVNTGALDTGLLIGATGVTVGRAVNITNNGTGTVTVGGTIASGTGTFSGAVTLGRSAEFNADGTSNITFSGAITGAGNLTKTGDGTVTLSSTSNAYTGSTNIGTAGAANAGTLALGASNVLPGTTLNLFGGTLAMGTFSDTVGALNLGGGASGSTASITGTGTLTLGGNLAYSATNNPNGALISSSLALGGNRTFTIGDSTAAAADLTISGIISGANAITKSGAGTLVLSAANTYTGATTISQGTIEVDANAPSGLAGALGNATTTVTLNDAGTGASNNALLIGATGLTIGRTVTVANLGTGTTTLGGNITTGTGAFTGNVTLNRSANLNADGTSTITFGTGAISGAGGITKTGDGTVVLSGTNGFTGATTVSAGTLQLTANAPSGANGTLGNAASAVTINDANTGASNTALTVTTSGVSVGRAISVANSGSGTTTLGGDSALTSGTASFTGNITLGRTTQLQAAGTSTVTFGTGAISGAGGITKTGTGTVVLSGTNSFTGNTTVNAGTLSVSADANLGTAPGAPTAASLTLSGGNLLATSGFTLAANRGITLSPATTNNITANTNQLLTIGGVVTGSGNIVFGTTGSGTGAVSLTGSNNYTGTTTIDAGALRFGANNALPAATAVTVNTNGTLDLYSFNGTIGSLTGAGTVDLSQAGQAKTLTLGNATDTTFSGTITNSGAGSALSLLKTGTGALTLSDTNHYTGSTTINQGTVKITSDSLTGGGLGNAPGSATPGNLTLGGGQLETGATLALSSNRGISLTSATSSTIAADTGTTLTYGGIIAGGGNITYGATTTGTGAGGAGTITLSGTNTNTGTTTLAAGTVSVGSIGNGGIASALGQASNAAGNLVFDGGTLQYTGATASTDRSFTINTGKTATIAVTNSAANLTMSGSSAATTGGLTKSGSGTLTLTGTNAYSGTTTVNAGTLAVNSAGAIGDGTGATTVTAGTLSLAGGLTFSRSGALTLNGAGASASTGALHSAGTGSTTTQWTGNITLGSASKISTLTGLLIIGNGSTFANTLDNGGNLLTVDATGTPAVTPLYQPSNTYVLDPTNLMINSRIFGTGGLLKTGDGTVTLMRPVSSGNPYTGDTTITGGKLIVDSVLQKPGISSTNIYVGNASSPGAADSVILQMGQKTGTAATNHIIGVYNATTGASDSNLTVYSDGLFDTNRGSNGFINVTLQGGHISGGDAASNPLLNVTGGLTTTASSRTAVIDNGRLGLSANNFTFTVASGTTPSGVDLRVDSKVESGIGFTGTGSTIGLKKDGLGKMVLTNSNTYGGITSITQGILNIQNNNALGQTGVTSGDTDYGTVVSSGAQLQLETSGAGLTISSLESLTLNGTGFSSDGALRNIAGTNTYNGFVYVATDTRINADSGSTLKIENTNGVGASIINGTAAGKNLTFGGNGNIEVNGGISSNILNLTKDGNGTLTLAGSNTYQGNTNVNAGVLKLTNGSALGGNATNTVTVTSGASLQLDKPAGMTLVNVPTTISGTGVDTFGAIRNLSGANTYGGQVTLAADSLITANSGSSLTLANGTRSTGTQQVTFGDTTYNGNITVGGMANNSTGAVVKNGSGSLTVNGATATMGTVTVNAGTTDFSSTTSTTTGTVNANNGATLNFNSPTTTTGVINVNNTSVVSFTGTTVSTGGSAVHLNSTAASGLNVGGTVAMSTGAIDSAASATLTIATGGTVTATYASGTTTFAGGMAGGGTFVKTGAGALSLTNGFTATGLDLTLSGGTLSATGNAFSIDKLTLGAGTTLSLGNGTHFTAQTIEITGNTVLDFNNSAGTFLSSANLIIAGGVTVTINNWVSNANSAVTSTVWYATGTVTINGTGYSPGTLPQINFSSYPGYTTTWVNGTMNGWFNQEIRPTPEPATYGLLLLSGSGALLALRRHLRRRNAKADRPAS